MTFLPLFCVDLFILVREQIDELKGENEREGEKKRKRVKKG